jgi:hypothetical protein
MAQSKLSRESKAWLDECILHQGMDWRQIKDLLRLDDTILDALENDSSLAAVPESLLISHKVHNIRALAAHMLIHAQDIYNRIRKRLLEVATLHRNGFRSLELWKEKLLEAGYDVFYEKISARATGEEHHFVFGFVSPWQKKVCSSTEHREDDANHDVAPSEIQQDCVPRFDAPHVLLSNWAIGEGISVFSCPEEPRYWPRRAGSIHVDPERGTVCCGRLPSMAPHRPRLQVPALDDRLLGRRGRWHPRRDRTRYHDLVVHLARTEGRARAGKGEALGQQSSTSFLSSANVTAAGQERV